MSLKYLFVAEFADGTSIQQDQEDASKLDPTKSQFYDVQNYYGELVKFSLSDILSLNLLTGEFVLNGNYFTIESPECYRRLIYFRRTTVHLNADLVPLDSEVEYHLGWQATVDGENVQRIVVVR